MADPISESRGQLSLEVSGYGSGLVSLEHINAVAEVQREGEVADFDQVKSFGKFFPSNNVEVVLAKLQPLDRMHAMTFVTSKSRRCGMLTTLKTL